MAGIIKTNAVQLGDSSTATQNFTLQSNVDGTVKLSRGNVGATTQDILTIDATGTLECISGLKVIGPIGFYNTTPISQPIDIPDTTGSSLISLEVEVNKLKSLLRSFGLLAS